MEESLYRCEKCQFVTHRSIIQYVDQFHKCQTEHQFHFYFYYLRRFALYRPSSSSAFILLFNRHHFQSHITTIDLFDLLLDGPSFLTIVHFQFPGQFQSTITWLFPMPLHQMYINIISNSSNNRQWDQPPCSHRLLH